MKKILLLISFTSALSFPALSQENKELSGKIIAPNLEGYAVHIINITQSTGTVNDASGDFRIAVRQNDTLLFSSIQYENRRIPVTAEVLNQENFIVALSEEVKELGEVNLSNLSLTGNLRTDLANMDEDEEPLFSLNIGDFMNARFDADVNDPLKKPQHLAAKQNEIVPIDNIIGVSFDLERLGNLFRNKRKSATAFSIEAPASVQIRELFDDEFFKTSLGVKKEYIKDFMSYLDTAALPQHIFTPEKRLDLIELLIAQGKIFTEGVRGQH